MTCEISIIIPTLNSPSLPDVVRSVKAQTTGDATVEIIVSGLDELGLVDPSDVSYVSQGYPLNPAAARNLGIRAASGDFLVFLDADCVPEPTWLARIRSFRCRQEGRSAVSGAIRILPDSHVRLAGNLASFREFTASLEASERPFLPSFSLGVPRRALSEAGWFNEQLPRGEDLDLTIRLARHGYRLWFDPTITVIHRPARTTLQALLRHAFESGRNSIRVRQRYRAEFAMPRWALSWPALLTLSPLIAGAVTVSAFLHNRDVRTWWPTLPLIFLSRLAWCLGACETLAKQSSELT